MWVFGYLGFRLGVAPSLGVPELLAEPGEGLATGTAMMLRIPVAIFRLALHEPLLIVLGFAAMALPAAGIAAARPIRRGAPRPTAGVVTLAVLATIIAITFAVAQVLWTLSPLRHASLPPLPVAADSIETWASALDLIAGIDMLALAAMVLWCVLMPRLPSPQWLRLLGTVLVLFATSIALVGAAVSGATAAHAHLPRSVVRSESAPSALLLGYTRNHTALLRSVDGTTMIILTDGNEQLTVTDRQSIIEALTPPAR